MTAKIRGVWYGKKIPGEAASWVKPHTPPYAARSDFIQVTQGRQNMLATPDATVQLLGG